MPALLVPHKFWGELESEPPSHITLRGLAIATIDVSNGLLGDLGHVLKQSGVGATVKTDIAIKLVATKACWKGVRDLFFSEIKPDQWLGWALAGGDDYELLFTAPAASRTPVTRIGRIDSERGLRLVNAQGNAVPNTYTSFDHFA